MIQKKVATKQLILRPLTLRDYSKWRDSHINRFPSRNRWDPGPKKPKDCSKVKYLKILTKFKAWAKEDDSYWYGVFDRENNTLIGFIDFDIFVRGTHQFANFGYQIFNRYWGLGYGKEAAAAGLIIGFKQLKLQRLEAAINLDNKVSVKLAKSIGMRKEGIKKNYWFENGSWVDHVIFVANPEDVGLKSKKPVY
jgi:[ribosomal protein S5]-alanine N-acetyltransferase